MRRSNKTLVLTMAAGCLALLVWQVRTRAQTGRRQQFPDTWLLALTDKTNVPAQTGQWEQFPDGSSGQPTEFTGQDGVKIAAYIRKPSGDGPFPLVVLLHGGAQSVKAAYALGRSTSEPTKEFIQAGWAVFSMDFRPGPSRPEESMGEQEWKDAIDGIEAAKKLSFVDSSRVAMMGGSHGANVLSRVASREDVQAAVLCAPAAIYLPEIAEVIKTGAKVNPVLGRIIANLEKKDGASIAEIGAHPEKYGYHSPFYEVNQVRMPILIINGQNDWSSPIPVVESYADRLQAAGKVVVMYLPENGPHGFQWGGPRRVPATVDAAQWAVAFIKSQFDRVGKPEGAAANPRAPNSKFQRERMALRGHGTPTEAEIDYLNGLRWTLPEGISSVMSPADLEYLNETRARMHAEYAQKRPPRDFIPGLVALTDLGKGTYQGEEGGLFPDGSNTPPPAYLEAGEKLAAQVVPRDAAGKPAPDGKIGLTSIGYSNPTIEWRGFTKLAEKHRSELNPALVIVAGAIYGRPSSVFADANSNYWQTEIPAKLREAGVTPEQVQVAWINETIVNPREKFPADAKHLEQDLAKGLQVAIAKFPNLKLVYWTPRIYAGYVVLGANPEPFCYDSGFAYKWIIARQVQGDAELNYDPAKGPVRAPWTSWSPDTYLWANGTEGRSDGLKWVREDLAPDGMHPSVQGSEKVGEHLLKFFETDPTTRPWFTKHE
jgi:dienelactone hydrolase